MTKKQSRNPLQKLYRNCTGNQIRGLGQFLVKTWSAFRGQPSGRTRADSEQFKAKQGGQKVSKNGADLLHHRFTKTSPDFGILSLEVLRQGFGAVSVVLEMISQEKCRQCDGKMSAVFTLLPQISEYMRKSPIQFDIPSSYLYVVVLQKLCL